MPLLAPVIQTDLHSAAAITPRQRLQEPRDQALEPRLFGMSDEADAALAGVGDRAMLDVLVEVGKVAGAELADFVAIAALSSSVSSGPLWPWSGSFWPGATL